jgi:hypothetical protein
MELRMTLNESWVYQGRQGHGYFGTGTAPKDDDSGNDAEVYDLFRPANAGQRVDYVASSLIMHVPRNDRGRRNSAASDSARANLKTAVAAWYGARSLSRDAFRSQFLDPYTSDEVMTACAAPPRAWSRGAPTTTWPKPAMTLRQPPRKSASIVGRVSSATPAIRLSRLCLGAMSPEW